MAEYNYDVQKLFLEMMMQDAQSFLRVQNIFNEENFDRDLREAAKFIMITRMNTRHFQIEHR